MDLDEISDMDDDDYYSKTIELFDQQFVWFSVEYSDKINMYNVYINFDDYASVMLRNTSGFSWSFLTKKLAWKFIHSDYIINLHYIFKLLTKSIKTQSYVKNSVSQERLKNLHTKLGKHLGVYKEFEKILDSKGNMVELPSIYHLTFIAKIQFGSINYGSHKFGFRLELENTLDRKVFVMEFNARELNEVCDINLEASTLVHTLNSVQFLQLIHNRKLFIDSCDDDNNEKNMTSQKTFDNFLEFFEEC